MNRKKVITKMDIEKFSINNRTIKLNLIIKYHIKILKISKIQEGIKSRIIKK